MLEEKAKRMRIVDTWHKVLSRNGAGNPTNLAAEFRAVEGRNQRVSVAGEGEPRELVDEELGG
jgi:hypothetical protein